MCTSRAEGGRRRRLDGAASLGPVLEAESCNSSFVSSHGVNSSYTAGALFWPELVSVRFLLSLENERVLTQTVPCSVLTAVAFSLMSHYLWQSSVLVITNGQAPFSWAHVRMELSCPLEVTRGLGNYFV